MNVPILDDEALLDLVDRVDDHHVAHRFVARYVQLLPVRIARIDVAVCAVDLETALDAALSLKVSSVTVGARELAVLAVAVEAALRRGAFAAATAHVRELPAAAGRARGELERYLDT